MRLLISAKSAIETEFANIVVIIRMHPHKKSFIGSLFPPRNTSKMSAKNRNLPCRWNWNQNSSAPQNLKLNLFHSGHTTIRRPSGNQPFPFPTLYHFIALFQIYRQNRTVRNKNLSVSQDTFSPTQDVIAGQILAKLSRFFSKRGKFCGKTITNQLSTKWRIKKSPISVDLNLLGFFNFEK